MSLVQVVADVGGWVTQLLRVDLFIYRTEDGVDLLPTNTWTLEVLKVAEEILCRSTVINVVRYYYPCVTNDSTSGVFTLAVIMVLCWAFLLTSY